MNEFKEDIPDFEGKCLSIAIMEDEHNYVLYDPHFEYQGGRLFIVGTVPEGATLSDWVKNCQGAVAWDRVTDYYVFESLDAYTKANALSRELEDSEENESI